ncbi:hypothetical protein BZA77DRAFT_320968 [Pyronema omphalodes]|nr:hypothetical protein BZA77DRAFT_320963 [Pyronema omphalodes]KAI5813716.1 hypothetical protein BZA77DRAFT_389746 [Pyronema omphalodes]KAI5813717.1 hypothetical protein BZA77DRAFT_373463 [Pyronema omphalodes]KAI5813718.1 hypothetical protein BZA77DRAFT_320968 [Pyronema omphalodes]
MQFTTIISVLAFSATVFGAAIEKRSGPVGVCPPFREDAHFLLADSSDCTVFYKCDRNGPVKLSCPEGLLYAPQHQWCDFPERSTCKPM